MKKKNTKKNRKTATCKRTRRKEIMVDAPPIQHGSTEPAMQLDIPLPPQEIPVERADVLLEEAMAKVEEQIEKICDSDRFLMDGDSCKECIDMLIQVARKNQQQLRAIKRKLNPGFLRRLWRRLHTYISG